MLCLSVMFKLNAQTGQSEYSGAGMVTLLDGSEVRGVVTYYPSSPGKVFVKKDGEEKSEKYKAKDVKEFTLSDLHYYSIIAKGGVDIGSDGAFGRLLNSPDSKIKLFLCESQSNIVVGSTPPVDQSYYALVPGETAAYTLSGMKFTPFKKMANIVADCPDLAKKITGKEEGYFCPMMTTDDYRLKVFLKVAEEYSNCK